MKRILSVFLCLCMLVGMCSFSFGATAADEIDVFEFFQDEMTFLNFFSGHVAEGEKYNPDAIFQYTKSELKLEYYGVGEPMGDSEYPYYEMYSVPAAVFEDEAKKHFVLDDALIAALRALDAGPWDPETETAAPLYNPETDAYEFFDGGLGDSAGYSTYGYVKNGNRYDVYLYYVERAYVLDKNDVLGEDYIFETNWDGSIIASEIMDYAKYVVEYDGEDLKFLWSQDLEAIPTIEGMTIREMPKAIVDDNFIYSPMNDGKELYASTYIGPEATEVTVPASVEGVPVTGLTAGFMMDVLETIHLPEGLTYIGDYVFSGMFGLTEITLPESLTTIGDSAFGYSGLTSVNIPAGVKSIGEQAFYACADLTAINVDAANTAYASADGVLFNKQKTTLLCYPAGKADESYAIPEGVKTIARGAFRDAWKLQEVTIPDTVTKIEAVAFAYSGLTSVTIPESVTTIKNYTFDGCSELERAYLPVGLTTIEEGAFMMSGLTSIVLPEGLTTIGSSAFGTYSLEFIVFPSSLQKIGSYCFPGAETVVLATYIGTAEEWAKVEKGTEWSTGEAEMEVTFAEPMKDEETGVQVFNSNGDPFDQNVVLSVKPVTDEDVLSKLDEYDNAMVLDITLLEEGEETQPEIGVTVMLPVPEGMNGKKCRIFRVEKDGTLTDMNARFQNGLLVFSTEHFSHYAVVEDGGLLGDVNRDGKVNTTDARLVLQYAAGIIGEEDLDLSVGDVDRNDKVNTTDARRILQYAAGIIKEF